MDNIRLVQLRDNAIKPEFNEAMEQLKREAGEASQIAYSIGNSEYGEWSHLYYCNQDGSSLQFDWSQPKLHLCPLCGVACTGEPYDSVWTTMAHVRIGHAVYHSSILFAIDGDESLLLQAKKFLLAYAEHYEGYRIHGEVPFNGPGKLFAQTLDEAHWIIDLAIAYDLLKEHLTTEENALIQEGLLRPCARFLIDHKEKQIHNHSVLITSAISSLGLLLEDEEIMNAGLLGEYGLFDQISQGLLEDGLWYEGNAQYHFYAFKSLLDFALLAEGTRLDMFSHKALKQMFDYPIHLILSDGSIPSLNDGGPHIGIGTYAPFYELAYGIYGDEVYRSLLNTAYGTRMRDVGFTSVTTVARASTFALFFGSELETELEDVGSRPLWKFVYRNISLPDSGLTKLVNESRLQVIVKHSKFGGEHDHMDRLGLSLICGDVPLMIDPGTTAYGVPVHYGWFKHTYSHNTVSINGADQPPSDGRMIKLEETTWGVWVETAVDWKTKDYKMKDRIILPPELSPWDNQAYEGVEIRRINILATEDNHFLDIVSVTLPESREVHLANHISGRLVDSYPEETWLPSDEKLSQLDQGWLKDKRKLAEGEDNIFAYAMKVGTLKQLCWCSESVDTFVALTPDNPPTTDRTSLIHRVEAENHVLFIQVLSYNPVEASKLALFEFDKLQVTATGEGMGTYSIEFACSGVQHSYSLEWREEGSIIDKKHEEEEKRV